MFYSIALLYLCIIGCHYRSNEITVLRREASMGLFLGAGLFVVGFLRVYMKHDARAALAIAVTLFVIVITATLVGAMLPLFFLRLGADPAHAGPTIQVVMDITGVLLTCMICALFLSGGAAITNAFDTSLPDGSTSS